MNYKVINQGLNNAVFNSSGELVLITDLSNNDKWSCQRCGDCCKKMNCIKLKSNSCNDYANRPIVCDLFPMCIMINDRVSFIKSINCPGWGKGKKVLFNDWIKKMVNCCDQLKKNPGLTVNWSKLMGRK